jgi:hypothetical protein
MARPDKFIRISPFPTVDGEVDPIGFMTIFILMVATASICFHLSAKKLPAAMLARIVSMMVVVVVVVVMMMMVVLVLVAIFATALRVSRYLPRNRSDHPSAQRRSQEGAHDMRKYLTRRRRKGKPKPKPKAKGATQLNCDFLTREGC